MWKRLRKSLHFNEAVCIKTIAKREILLGHVPLYLFQMNIDEYVDFSLKIACLDLGIEINYWHWYHQTNIALLIYRNRKPMKCEFAHMNKQEHETEN